MITGTKEEILECIGDKFVEIDATKSEGAGEKHLPEVKEEGNIVTVQVGSVAHPMTDEHSIEWIYLQTEEGSQLKKLKSGQEPRVQFALSEGDKPVAAYAYCNLHGFWETKM